MKTVVTTNTSDDTYNEGSDESGSVNKNKNNGGKSGDSISNRGEWYENRKKVNSFI